MVGFLAARILFNLRRNSYPFYFTLLSLLGMALGAACLLLIMAFMTGAQQLIRDKYLASAPHLSVLPSSGRFLPESPGFARELLLLPGVVRVERKLTLPAAGPDWYGDVEGSDAVSAVQAPFGRRGDRFTLLVPLLVLNPLGVGPRSLLSSSRRIPSSPTGCASLSTDSAPPSAKRGTSPRTRSFWMIPGARRNSRPWSPDVRAPGPASSRSPILTPHSSWPLDWKNG